MNRKINTIGMVLFLVAAQAVGQANTYEIDEAHSFVQFRVSHLGFSYILGRFNKISGKFQFDADKPNEANITAKVRMKSIDTNHSLRDKHLRGKDFLHVKGYPEASFQSTRLVWEDSKTGTLKGTLEGILTLHGVAKSMTFNVEAIGSGKDPWGGYRRGFMARGSLMQSNFSMQNSSLGTEANAVYLEIYIEGVQN
ncbi:MAG: YceI family protein [Gammaproteobacteria bacterium]|nr:YceI family protein [Gammaproteobacteria bacterium]